MTLPTEFHPRRLAVGEGHSVWMKTPEDTILRKLEWFRNGGEVSGRQWHDVIEILRAAPDALDDAHLDHWAGELAVSALLERARLEAGGE